MPRGRKDTETDLLKKSDWIEYLSYVASKNQNLKISFYATFFAALTIIVAILVSLSQLGINDTLAKGIAGVILSIYVILLWREAVKFTYGINPLIDKSADRLLSDILSNKYPELKNAKGIQKKWAKLKQEINKTNHKERKKLLKEKTKKVPDKSYFDKWFNEKT